MKLILLIAVVSFTIYSQHDAMQTIAAARERVVPLEGNSTSDRVFMRRALALGFNPKSSRSEIAFGCVIVKEGSVIGEGWDSTDLAGAIHNAISNVESVSLNGSVIYLNIQPDEISTSLIESIGVSKIFYCIPANPVSSPEGMSTENPGNGVPQIQLLADTVAAVLKSHNTNASAKFRAIERPLR